jgi:PAS domain S-box-containing protein
MKRALTNEASQQAVESAHLRLLVENSGDILWFKQMSPPQFTLVSPAFQRLFGVEVDRLQADADLWQNMVHREDRQLVRKAMRAWLGGTAAEYAVSYRIVRPDGGVRWLADRGIILGRRNGKPFQMGGITRDITDEVAASAARSRLAAVVESSEDAIITLDLHGRVQTWNQGARKIFGYTAEEIVGRPVAMLRPPKAADDEKVFRKLIKQGRPIEHYETVRQRKDGCVINISLTISPLYDAEGKLVGYSKVSRDITERKLAESMIFKLNARLEQRVQERTLQLQKTNEELRALLAERRRMEEEILSISEREQRRIGQDLHDDLGQHLAGAWMMCRALERQLSDHHVAEADAAGRLVNHLEGAVNRARMLARGLQPVSPEQGGLVQALEGLATMARQVFSLHCEISISAEAVPDDSSVATHLYRIAQEAVNNAARHGEAQRVTIELTRDGECGQLVVRDNGKGISQSRTSGGGMGLRNMNYRAAMMRGTVTVKRIRPKGTEVKCRYILPPVSNPTNPNPNHANQENWRKRQGGQRRKVPVTQKRVRCR